MTHDHTPDWGAHQQRQDADDYQHMAIEQEHHQRTIEFAAFEFLQACHSQRAAEPAAFAPATTDWRATLSAYGTMQGERKITRAQPLAECMADTFSTHGTPGRSIRDDCMQLVLDASRGANAQAAACDLLERMAREWAEINN